MSFCCGQMKEHIEHACDIHSECPDKLITITKNGYGLIIHDGGESVITINYCPFCGSELRAEKSPIFKQESIYDIDDPVYGCYGNREGLTYHNGEWVERDD